MALRNLARGKTAALLLTVLICLLSASGCTSRTGTNGGGGATLSPASTVPGPNPIPASTGQQTGLFHVSPSGDDSNPGTAEQPWKTLQHAADSATPGYTVYIHAGTYDENIRFEQSGTEVAPITFMAAPGEAVTVKSLEFIRGVSHIRVRNLQVNGFHYWGITVHGDNRDLQFSGLEISGGEAGFRFTRGESGQPPAQGPVSDILVEDTRVQGVKYTGVDCTPGPCSHMTFRRLEVSGSGLGEGVDFGGDGLGVEKGDHITVEECTIHDNGGDGIDLNSRDPAGNVPGIVVRNNQVFRNHQNGIKLWAGGFMEKNAVWGQGINPVVGCVYDCTLEIVQNTVAYDMWATEFGSRDYASTFGYPEGSGPVRPSVALTLKGNIFAFNSRNEPTGIYLGPGVRLIDERDNVFSSRSDEEIFAAFLQDRSITRDEIASGEWTRLTGTGQGDLTVDPLFASGWPEVDLHLKPGSPAMGKGAY